MTRPMRNSKDRKAQKRTLLARDGDCCWICDQPLGDDITVDHVIEQSKGGASHLGNLKLAHKLCNSRRSDQRAAA